MSCYMRHLSAVFAQAGIEHNRKNARLADPHIRRIVGKEGAHCPVVWKEVKLWLADPEKTDLLAHRLGQAFGSGADS